MTLVSLVNASWWQPSAYWTAQRCPVCEGKGRVPNNLTLEGDQCTTCGGKKLIVVSGTGEVRQVK